MSRGTTYHGWVQVLFISKPGSELDENEIHKALKEADNAIPWKQPVSSKNGQISRGMASLKSEGVMREKRTRSSETERRVLASIFGDEEHPPLPRTFCIFSFNPWHSSDIRESEFPGYRKWVEDILQYVRDQITGLFVIRVEINLNVTIGFGDASMGWVISWYRDEKNMEKVIR